MPSAKNVSDARDVDRYLAAQRPPARATLSLLRKQIRALAPQATEVISYQVPTFRYKGGALVSYAAFPKHVSLYVISFAFMRAHKALLKPYYTSGVTIRFPIDKPLPASLVKRIIKWRMAENDRREAAKAKGKATSYGKPRAKPKTGPRPNARQGLKAAAIKRGSKK